MAFFKATIFALLVAVAIAKLNVHRPATEGLKAAAERQEPNMRGFLFGKGLQTHQNEKTGLKEEFETAERGDEEFETSEEDDHYTLMEKVKNILERIEKQCFKKRCKCNDKKGIIQNKCSTKALSSCFDSGKSCCVYKKV
ncbi:uncharacterized protein LOC116618581 [Nematostella vectensis]|uniref:uncharacterized protein LOC116618581 n=1 Tax=Nematostella vectensis TaxID=45351 RepID=UPI00138FAA3C|nr:uncharacterized protein LOC116618581 [Nematostella vectensis]